MVVAEPLAPVIEGNDEEVFVLELLEHLRRVVALEHRVAQGAAHAIENRGPKQEFELSLPEAGKLFGLR